jgi:hypothetical protein
MHRCFLPWAVASVIIASPAFAAPEPQKPEAAAGQQASADWKQLPPLPFKKESIGDFSAPGIRVQGFYSGTPLTVDEAFTTLHENTPPSAAFTVTVPKDKEIFFTPGGKKSGIPELAKLIVATPDKRAIEILRFANLTVPLQPDPADRLKLCAHLLQTQALAGASKGYEKVAFLEAYATKIGGNDAACVHAHMTSAKSGEHYAVKLVGILHPGQPGSVLAFLMADTALSDIKDPADLGSKGTGLAILHSLRFNDPPKTGAKP